MDYTRIYFKLIRKRRENPLPKNEYGENHHIIPRSFGGSNEKNNLIRLSAREHFICHFLLYKIYKQKSKQFPNSHFIQDKYQKMLYAFNMMFWGNPCRKSASNLGQNSRVFEQLKKDYYFFRKENASNYRKYETSQLEEMLQFIESKVFCNNFLLNFNEFFETSYLESKRIYHLLRNNGFMIDLNKIKYQYICREFAKYHHYYSQKLNNNTFHTGKDLVSFLFFYQQGEFYNRDFADFVNVCQTFHYRIHCAIKTHDDFIQLYRDQKCAITNFVPIEKEIHQFCEEEINKKVSGERILKHIKEKFGLEFTSSEQLNGFLEEQFFSTELPVYMNHILDIPHTNHTMRFYPEPKHDLKQHLLVLDFIYKIKTGEIMLSLHYEQVKNHNVSQIIDMFEYYHLHLCQYYPERLQEMRQIFSYFQPEQELLKLFSDFGLSLNRF